MSLSIDVGVKITGARRIKEIAEVIAPKKKKIIINIIDIIMPLVILSLYYLITNIGIIEYGKY